MRGRRPDPGAAARGSGDGATASIATATTTSASSRGSERRHAWGSHGIGADRGRTLQRWVAWRPTPRRSPMSQNATSSTTIPVTLDPRRRHRPRVRDRRPADPRSRRRADRLGGRTRPARRSSRRACPPAFPRRRWTRSPGRASRLKGPLETPVGFGEKSANVTLRKLFETYANVRPVREMPGVKTPYCGRGVDLVVVRENVEDLYAGHRVHADARRRRVPEAHLA